MPSEFTPKSISIVSTGTNYQWTLQTPLASGNGGGGPTPPASGNLLGDVTGPFTTNTVVKINNNPLGLTTPTTGNILIADGTKWNTEHLSGVISLTSTGVTSLNNTGVSPGTYGSADHVAQFTVGADGRLTSVNTVAIVLDNTGVTPGTYGDATHVGVFTVGFDGRIDSASSVAIPLPPSPSGFAVGGVLTGTLPNPGMAPTGVTPGTYGSASGIPVVTVGADGRIDSITVDPISSLTIPVMYSHSFMLMGG